MYALRTIISSLFLLCGCLAFAQDRAPEIRNLKAEVDTTAGEVHISYDLVDPDSPTVEVFLRASGDHGQSWLLYTHEASGDIGINVRPGKNKRIVWKYNKKVGDVLDYKVKLVADDGDSPGYHTLVNQVKPEEIEEDVNTLQGTRHYLHGAPGLEIAKKLLYNRFFDEGLDARKQSFMLGGYEGHNISGSHKGQVDETKSIVVIGHYDTHAESAGADDNASGVAAMLEAASILSKYHFRQSIVFVGVDLQKQGAIGVRRYVQKLSAVEKDGIEAVYNLDNVGVFSDQPLTQEMTARQKKMFTKLARDLDSRSWQGDFLFAISNTQSIPARTTFVEMASAYAPQLRVEGLKTAGKGTEEFLFANGTYQAFWEQEIPAVLITDGAETRNKNYETASDLSRHLDYSALSDVVRALVATIAHDAEWIHGDVETCGISLQVKKRTPPPVVEGLVDFHLYLTDENEELKVRINHPKYGKLRLKLMDTKGEIFYNSKIDLYYESVISIDVSYLNKGVYLVNLSGDHFDELKEFIMPAPH